MNRYDLLTEAYDHFDSAVLEMVLADTVETFCIENEGGFEFVEEYINLLESGKATDEHLEDFSLVISETFANQMSPYLGLIYEAEEADDVLNDLGSARPKLKTGLRKFTDDTLKPNVEKAKTYVTGKYGQIKKYATDKVAAAKGKWNDLKDTFKTYKDISLKPRMRAWGEKLKTLKARLSPEQYLYKIKQGFNNAKNWVGEKAGKVSKAVTGGIAAAKFKAADWADRAGKKVSSVGSKISKTANAAA